MAARDGHAPRFLNNLNQFAGTLISGIQPDLFQRAGTRRLHHGDLRKRRQRTELGAQCRRSAVYAQQRLVQHPGAGQNHRPDADDDINVNLNGGGKATSLTDLAAQLNAVNGITATIGSDNHLTIASTSPSQQFSFANDTSGILTSLGINTFFTGSSAGDIGVNSAVPNDPSTFAASQGGIAADTDNAVYLAQFPNQALASQNGNSLTVLYDNMVNGVTQGSAQAQAAASSADSFATTLSNQAACHQRRQHRRQRRSRC